MKRNHYKRLFILPVIVLSAAGLLVSCAGNNQQANIAAAHKAYTEHNYGLAYRTLLKAVRSGDAKSEYALGFLYYQGMGAPYDPVLARKWIGKAARKNYPPAVRALDLMNKRRVDSTSSDVDRQAPAHSDLGEKKELAENTVLPDAESTALSPAADASSGAKTNLPKPKHSYMNK